MNTILVPLDGSTFGEAALPTALAIALRSGSALRLVHVSPVAPLVPSRIDEQPMVEWADQYMAGIVARLRVKGDVEVDARVLVGEPRDVLLDHAVRAHADLVILSTHGRGGLDRAWLGSVADAVVRGAGVPVLLVRPDDQRSVDLTTVPEVARVLVASDGSEESAHALDVATNLSMAMGADLRLLHVIEVGPIPFVPEGVTEPRAEPEEIEEWKTRLESGAAKVRSAGVPIDIAVRVDDRAFEGVLLEATSWDADLIVLGTRGRGGVTRMLIGSVADKVVRRADRPVLVVPPDPS